MNVKALIPLIIGLAIGGFALKMGLDTLQKAKAGQTETVNVWAARANIPRGAKITEEMITPMAFPGKLVPMSALKDKEQVIGRVPRVEAPAGLPILEEMLLAPGEPAGVHVPPGLRAVAVKIDEGSGVDFHLEPGCHVDVVGYFTVRNRNRQETVARTIIENVRVAAVGPRLSAVTVEGEERASRPTRAVTLLVKPEQVPYLHLAEQRGKIKLSMRNEEDSGEVGPVKPISEAELIDPTLAAADEEDEQQEQKTGGMFGLLKGMFAKSDGQTEGQPGPVVEVLPEPREPPWVVVVYRGGEPEVVRFKSRDSRERVEPQPAQPVRGGARRAQPARGAGYVPPPATSTPPNRTRNVSEGHVSQGRPSAQASNPQIAQKNEQDEQDQEPQEPSE